MCCSSAANSSCRHETLAFPVRIRKDFCLKPWEVAANQVSHCWAASINFQITSYDLLCIKSTLASVNPFQLGHFPKKTFLFLFLMSVDAVCACTHRELFILLGKKLWLFCNNKHASKETNKNQLVLITTSYFFWLCNALYNKLHSGSNFPCLYFKRNWTGWRP